MVCYARFPSRAEPASHNGRNSPPPALIITIITITIIITIIIIATTNTITTTTTTTTRNINSDRSILTKNVTVSVPGVPIQAWLTTLCAIKTLVPDFVQNYGINANLYCAQLVFARKRGNIWY